MSFQVGPNQETNFPIAKVYFSVHKTCGPACPLKACVFQKKQHHLAGIFPATLVECGILPHWPTAAHQLPFDGPGGALGGRFPSSANLFLARFGQSREVLALDSRG
jgi:hypothetical protein